MSNSTEKKIVHVEMEIYPLQINYMPDFIRKKAQTKMDDTPENRERCLKELKVLLEGKWEPEESPFEEMKKLLFLIFQQELRNPVTQIAGFNTIHDFKNTGLRHLRYCTLPNLYLLYHVSADCLPVTILEMHCINGNLLQSTMLTISRVFLCETIRKAIYLHSSPEELLKFFPRSVLPVQYGGDLTDYYMTDWMKKANEHHSAFPVGGQKNIF